MLFLTSCPSTTIHKRESVVYVHTSVSCPNGRSFILRFSRERDVMKGMVDAIDKRKNDGTNEPYTIIRYGMYRSAKIDNIVPEELVKCSLREIPISPTERKMAEGFFR